MVGLFVVREKARSRGMKVGCGGRGGRLREYEGLWLREEDD